MQGLQTLVKQTLQSQQRNRAAMQSTKHYTQFLPRHRPDFTEQEYLEVKHSLFLNHSVYYARRKLNTPFGITKWIKSGKSFKEVQELIHEDINKGRAFRRNAKRRNATRRGTSSP